MQKENVLWEIDFLFQSEEAYYYSLIILITCQYWSKHSQLHKYVLLVLLNKRDHVSLEYYHL